jgi:hypothetical protein
LKINHLATLRFCEIESSEKKRFQEIALQTGVCLNGMNGGEAVFSFDNQKN